MARHIDLPRYIPPYLKEYPELMAILKTEEPEFAFTWDEIDKTRWNQFILTADELGIKSFEDLLGITAKKGEDLEFRRQRLLLRLGRKSPYTMAYLKKQLDIIIGEGNYNAWVSKKEWYYLLDGSWSLGEHPFGQEPFVLNIETAVVDQYWYQEVEILIGEIKPANIVYRYTPMIGGTIGITEEIQTYKYGWNYGLDGSWYLGQKAFLTDSSVLCNYILDGSWQLGDSTFISESEGDIVKGRGTPSLQDSLMHDYAQFGVTTIAKVVINDLVDITDLELSVEGGRTILKYIVPDQVEEVRDIKIYDSNGVLKSHSPIFIPRTAEQIKPKHIIYHEEVL